MAGTEAGRYKVANLPLGTRHAERVGAGVTEPGRYHGFSQGLPDTLSGFVNGTTMEERATQNPNDRAIKPYVFTRYDDPTAADEPYDSRYPDVARRLSALISGRMPDVEVEHIGSTAIPGCAGKGVVDVMVLYSPGRLIAARDTLTGMGFQEFVGREPFPDDRPVFVGVLDHDGDPFRVHVHVIPQGASEIATQRMFRDRLRADPDLVSEYVALKRHVLAAGINDSADYNQGKEAFIREVIDGVRNRQPDA